MPTIIQPLSASALDYLAAFDLRCICVTSSGRVYTTKNPQVGAVAAWWCRAADADAVANASWMNADVVGAANRLQVSLTPHDVVLRRVGERTAKIDEAIAQAVDRGVLKQFNSEYRKRRLAAKRSGQPFMPYSQALSKLRKVLADTLAGGGKEDPKIPTRSFVASVFDET
jgi:hypothetical protein